jgi:hypothetical protein
MLPSRVVVYRESIDPVTGRVHGTDTLHVSSTRAWTSWQTVPATLNMADGTNLVVYSVERSGRGAVNLDYLALP